MKELKLSNPPTVQKLMERAHKAAIEGLKKSIVEIEAQLKQIIKEDEGIRKNYQLLLSVPGVGHLTALHIIRCMNNFAVRISGKQLGSYAGVMPFEYKRA